MKKLLLFLGTAAVAAAVTIAHAEDAYIESAGVTGMDTEYHLKPTSRIELDFQLTTLEQTDQARVFGTDYNAAALKTGCSIYISTVYLVYGVIGGGEWGTMWMKDSGGNFILHDTDRHRAVFDFPGTIHRHETGGSVTATYLDPERGKYKDESTQPLALFANKTDTGFNRPAKVRIFGMKIYESDELVHDFQPCVTDGLAGFRDSVTGKFIGGGTKPSSFTAGGDYPTYESPYVATPADNNAYYIDTEYQASSNTCFMLDCAPLGTWTSGMSAWYLFYGYGSKPFDGYISGAGYGTQNGAKNGNGQDIWDTGIVALDDLTPGTRRTFALDNFNKKSFALVAGTTNGTVKAISASTESHPANTYTVKIASNHTGSNNYVPMKVYGCKIYESGELVRDFVPCYKNGIAGLKDMITGLFVSYPSDKARTTSGSLSCGGTGLLVESDPYIEGSGLAGQYFETNYKAKKTTRVEIDFAQTADDNGTHYIFGSRGESSGLSFFAYTMANKGNYCFSCADGSARWDTGGTYPKTTARQIMVMDAKNAKFVHCDEYGVTNAYWTTPGNRTTDADVGFVIFGTREGTKGVPSPYMPMKLYSCKLYDGDNQALVRDYRPAVKNGVIGLKDISRPDGEFIEPAGSENAFTYGGVFNVEARQDKDELSVGEVATLTASAPGATSYRWLKNGEPMEGGSSGTLTVAWRKPKSNPTDVYQAIARYTVDGLTAESEPSAEMPVENEPAGAVIIFR